MKDMAKTSPSGLFAPLRHDDFRRVWLASVPSNFGLLINAVGAGWAMTQLSGRADMVASVQTALMLPYMLFAIPAGAVADTYDRRKVGMVALVAATLASGLLFAFAWVGLLTPWLLLAFCFLNGAANAMFGPVWMSSAGEQLPREDLPVGIALNSMSYNIARAFGPAVGGVVVAAAGAVAAFGTNAASYLPMLWAQARWRRAREEPRLPPEQVGTAILSGLRYVGHSPQLRHAIIRTILFGLAAASIQALLPLVASKNLHGGAGTYGILLGIFGTGAVIGAATVAWTRERFSSERQISIFLTILSAACLGVALARNSLFAGACLLAGGLAWMQITNALNVSIQTRAPRWVTGRAVAAYQASVAGGLAIGSWFWGTAADTVNVSGALACSAGAILIVALVGWFIPLAPFAALDDGGAAHLEEPDVEVELVGRSGPIVVIVEYEIAPERAREFYEGMTMVRGIRLRNGGYGWSLARDIANPSLWLERFHTPTWNDYLRQRERMTEAERKMIIEKIGEAVRVRRLLERPVGSVRWRENSRDPGVTFPPASHN
ncbi:MFS transporter [Novosphingobium malaysiense]|uniref:MFS transporter n=1 Tax=Novosphingobium malaysiense TaxID=1348853 RepID=A0A0B1ZDU4_9SPHN|nr:MFS transporter [Novosphingobium malaysiense]KHK89214.1 hypothetical protein LK12_21985 [Novosphingobium malaysiense]